MATNEAGDKVCVDCGETVPTIAIPTDSVGKYYCQSCWADRFVCHATGKYLADCRCTNCEDICPVTGEVCGYCGCHLPGKGRRPIPPVEVRREPAPQPTPYRRRFSFDPEDGGL